MTDQTQLPKLGQYLVGETIGSGLCEVKLVFDQNTSRAYAAKVCKEDISRTRLSQEASIIRALNHASAPNVINTVEFCDFTATPKKSPSIKTNDNSQQNIDYKCKSAMIMELCFKQTFFDFVSLNGGLNEKLARSYFKVLMRTIYNIHSLGYVHRDIKLENILIDNNYNLKLADFGFGRHFNQEDGDQMTCRLGTGYYMAPEIKTFDVYFGTKVDMFACGVLLFLMIFGKIPFKQASATDILYRHFSDEKPERYWKRIEKHFNIEGQINNEFKSMMNGLLAADPERRFTAEQILECEWMQGETFTEENLAEIMKKNLELNTSTNP